MRTGTPRASRTRRWSCAKDAGISVRSRHTPRTCWRRSGMPADHTSLVGCYRKAPASWHAQRSRSNGAPPQVTENGVLSGVLLGSPAVKTWQLRADAPDNLVRPVGIDPEGIDGPTKG